MALPTKGAGPLQVEPQPAPGDKAIRVDTQPAQHSLESFWRIERGVDEDIEICARGADVGQLA